MLDSISQLPEDHLWNVQRALSYEINANALRSDQANDLLDFFLELARNIVEEQMRFVEEEDELRFGEITRLGHPLEQLGQQPEEERRVNLWRLHQLGCREDVYHSPSAGVGLHQVIQIECGLSEECVGPLSFEREEIALNGSDARRRDGAVVQVW